MLKYLEILVLALLTKTYKGKMLFLFSNQHIKVIKYLVFFHLKTFSFKIKSFEYIEICHILYIN